MGALEALGQIPFRARCRRTRQAAWQASPKEELETARPALVMARGPQSLSTGRYDMTVAGEKAIAVPRGSIKPQAQSERPKRDRRAGANPPSKWRPICRRRRGMTFPGDRRGLQRRVPDAREPRDREGTGPTSPNGGAGRPMPQGGRPNGSEAGEAERGAGRRQERPEGLYS